jgi:uncharacterized repeat protein (TIGR01451 family)
MQIVDTLDGNIEYISPTFSSPVTSITASGQVLTVNFTPVVTAGTIGSFTIRVRFRGGVTPDNTTVLNSATISADGVPSVNSNSVSITSHAQDISTLTKSVQVNSAPDNLSQYLLSYCPAAGNFSNHPGYLLPTNLTITDTLPPGAVYVSASPAPSSISGILLGLE